MKFMPMKLDPMKLDPYYKTNSRDKIGMMSLEIGF